MTLGAIFREWEASHSQKEMEEKCIPGKNGGWLYFGEQKGYLGGVFIA